MRRGVVPWWGPDRREVTLQLVLVYLVAEVARHAGHADILRESIDGAAGRWLGDPSLTPPWPSSPTRGSASDSTGCGSQDIIRAADVFRSSAYRRWPNRDAFVEDDLVELAPGRAPTGHRGGRRAACGEVLAAHAGRAADPADPADRRDLFVEMVRLTFEIHLAATASSPEFCSYLSRHAGSRSTCTCTCGVPWRRQEPAGFVPTDDMFVQFSDVAQR
jgi:hypothetical protein